MAIVRVGHTAKAAATTDAINSTGATFAVVAVSAFPFSPLAVTDSNSTAFTAGTPKSGGNSGTIQIFYAQITGGAGYQITASNGTAYGVALAVYSGVAASSPADQHNEDGAGGSPQVTGSITPTQDNELLFFACGGYSNGVHTTAVSVGSILDDIAGIGGTSYGVTSAEEIQTTATTRNESFTLSGNDGTAAAVLSFKAAAAGGATGWGPLLSEERNRMVIA